MTRKLLAALAAAPLMLAASCTSSHSDSSSPEPSALLAPRGELSGNAVDGMGAGQMEQLAFHIHAHLAIYVDGVPRLVPAGIGIGDGGSFFYWVHTHDESGVIHMEAPVQHTFSLGEFFDLWGQPLSDSQVGPARGVVTVLVNGSRVSGDPRAVPLDAHAQIQLDVGGEVPFQPFDFAAGL